MPNWSLMTLWAEFVNKTKRAVPSSPLQCHCRQVWHKSSFEPRKGVYKRSEKGAKLTTVFFSYTGVSYFVMSCIIRLPRIATVQVCTRMPLL